MGDASVVCVGWCDARCIMCFGWCDGVLWCVMCCVCSFSVRAGGVLFKTRTQDQRVLEKKREAFLRADRPCIHYFSGDLFVDTICSEWISSTVTIDSVVHFEDVSEVLVQRRELRLAVFISHLEARKLPRPDYSHHNIYISTW